MNILVVECRQELYREWDQGSNPHLRFEHLHPSEQKITRRDKVFARAEAPVE